MTAPRMPLFQRKAPMGGQPEGQPPEMEGAAEGDGQPITCQACGAQIDPTTGAVVGGGAMDGQPAGDVSSKLAAMMGGG